jgi:ubiquinone/menaquinone biosynthesis C-methylase UbiE
MVNFPSWVFRALYWYLNRLDKDNQLTFMNYGYSDTAEKIALSNKDEKNRYSIQLYHYMSGLINLKNKDVVEVGSGRGGGLEYIARTSNAASLIGIDVEKSAVGFSNRHHRHPNLSYLEGDALKIPLEDNSCDVVLNVESSHRYRSMETFLTEVKRILRPGGTFLFTDFRFSHEWPDLNNLLEEHGFKVMSHKDITPNILHSLDRDSERRELLIKRYAPRILHKGILNFSGSKGSETYDLFTKREFVYKSFLLQKLEGSNRKFERIEMPKRQLVNRNILLRSNLIRTGLRPVLKWVRIRS